MAQKPELFSPEAGSQKPLSEDKNKVRWPSLRHLPRVIDKAANTFNSKGLKGRSPKAKARSPVLGARTMEALTRIVADSLARHGLDRPVDPRRLQWSRWTRCDSPHSLLVVPSKPGIFALAEEIMDLGPSSNNVGTAEPSLAEVVRNRVSDPARPGEDQRDLAGSMNPVIPSGAKIVREADDLAQSRNLLFAGSAATPATRRMLAVLQFSEDDDMAFTLDRMFTRINPMRDRLASGRCFLRFVVIEDATQRRNICAALNQWMLTSAEKASGLPSDFQSSLELTTDRAGRALSDSANRIPNAEGQQPINQTLNLDNGASKNLHCPLPLPSGF
jgi:hypothetical protein